MTTDPAALAGLDIAAAAATNEPGQHAISSNEAAAIVRAAYRPLLQQVAAALSAADTFVFAEYIERRTDAARITNNIIVDALSAVRAALRE